MREPGLLSVVTLVGGGLLLAGSSLWLDRGSLERGNRLYRAGDAGGAAAVYVAVTQSDSQGVASYNLGTALLPSDPLEAEISLRSALGAGDSVMAHHARYNLGYRYLSAVSGAAAEPDSAMILLREAIGHLREALRIDPADDNSRWNLALAQRRLDALAPITEEPSRESGGTNDDEMVIDDASLSRSETAEARSGLEPEDPRAADNSGERQGALEGAREAWALQDPGPLTRDAAQALLGRVSDDPEILIRGILWSHRPDVAWWLAEPYPGGGW